MPQASPASKRPREGPQPKPPQFFFMWLALPMAVYVLMPTHSYYWDGVAFAIQAEKNLPLRELFYPTHLIYAVVHTWLYQAVAAVGLHTRALYLMQYVNMMLASACAPLMYRAFRRRIADRDVAIAGTLLFAFTATWWRFATDANAYIPAVFLLLCAFDLLETDKSPIVAGLLYALAMLFHQLAILFLPIALLRLRDRRKALEYLAAAFIPVVAAYTAAYRSIAGGFDVGGFFHWLVAAPPVGVGKFSFQPLHDLQWTFLGTARLLFGGKLDTVRGIPLTSVIPLALLVVLLIWRFRKLGAGVAPARPGREILLWAAIYVAFLFFWMPQNTFYRMFYLAPLVLALVVRIPRLSLLCAVAFLWNGLFVAYPDSRVQNNIPLKFALQQQRRWPPGTPIAFSNFHTDLWVISYFNPQASWVGMPVPNTAALDQWLALAQGRNETLWLEASMHDSLAATPEGRRWLESHPLLVLSYHIGKQSFTFYELK